MPNTQALNLLTVPTGALSVVDRSIPAHGDLQSSGTATAPWFSLIVPTYQEAKNIEGVIRSLSNLLDQATAGEYELIIVDDNSPDHTWAIASSLIPQYPNLRVMRRTEERGLSTAVIRGWQVAQGSVLGVMDGDLQHPPETLLKMLDQMRLGVDLVVASRHVDEGGVSNWNFMRRCLSRGAQMLGLIICPDIVGRVSDPMSGYFMVRRRAIADCVMEPYGYKILLEVLGRGRIQAIAEVGYIFQERMDGESKVTWQQYADYIIHLAKLRSRGRVSRLRRQLKMPIARFLRFGVVGLSGVVVDMTVLFILSDPSMLALGLTRSKILAAETAIVNNFIWNDSWTFGDISKTQTSWNARIKRFLKFNLICLMGLMLNVLLLNLFFNVFGMNRYLANLLAIAMVTLWNFWINLKLSWRVTDSK